MATFVVSVESEAQLAPEHLRLAAPTQDRRFATLLVSALTLFALAVHGYHPYAEDGGLYLTSVQRLLDPSLFSRSAAFVLEPTRHSLFAPMVAALVRFTHLGLPLTLLLLQISSIWATLFTAWMIASRCWPSRTARAGAVMLLACWLTLPVAGTALAIMDPYLTARSLSTPCTLLALAATLGATDSSLGLLARRLNIAVWLASICLAAIVHPLMAAYMLGATVFLASLRSSNPSARIGAIAAIAAASLSVAVLIHFAARPESADYRRIALTRTYWFPAAWSWYELIGLAAPLAILAIFVFRTGRTQTTGVSHPSDTLAQMAIATGVTAWIAAALFSLATAATHLVARLQPLRVFHIVYLIMILLLGAKLGDTLLRRHLWRWIATMLILGGIMATTSRAAFQASPHLEIPWVRATNPWVQAFVWIRDNTPKDALFALDADYINTVGEDAQCFRAIAERSSLPDYSKDGGEASIAPDLTAEWNIGQRAQQQLSAPGTSDAMRSAALRPLGVSWLVLDAHAITNLECPFTNSAVKVCHLP